MASRPSGQGPPPAGPGNPGLLQAPPTGGSRAASSPAAWLRRLYAQLLALVIHLLSLTLRYRMEKRGEPLPEEPFIFCLWHNRLAVAVPFHTRYLLPRRPSLRLAALVSASHDGSFLSRILRRFRIRAVRGSSSRRGGPALKELVRLAREGWTIAITPDGPRGPRYRIGNEGILKLAQLTGLPILPISWSLSSRWTLRSWDRFQIPRPFAACTIHTAPLLRIPRRCGASSLQEWGRRLEREMRGITRDGEDSRSPR